MTKYIVTAVARSRNTGFQLGKIRRETIDTKNNVLFPHDDVNDIRRRYENFWNDLNKASKEIVTVLKIRKK